jgi:hypothetical protein
MVEVIRRADKKSANSGLFWFVRSLWINRESWIVPALEKGRWPFSAKKKWFPLDALFWGYVACFITLFIHVK